ncbi:MAG: tetratricopeptide repeat protein, partial [Bacteroidetes bacterium]|nr:tetratricopeptide repeat protein [Bacteroidota bacterium]
SLNLYGDEYKAKNYISAYPYWKVALTLCPKSSKSLYIKGSAMLKAFIKEETDEARKAVLIDSLLWLYDERIKNFGQEGFVKGRKGADVLKYKKDHEAAYELEARCYELEQNKMEPGAVNTYFKTAYTKFKKETLDKGTFMELYLKLSDVVGANLGDAKQAVNYKKVQEVMDNIFGKIANCEDLIKVFQPRFDATPDDVALLKIITKLLDKVDCTESELFYNASVKLDALEPSEDSKYNLGKMSMIKKKYQEALAYFKAAVDMAEDDDKKGKYLFKTAEAYKALGQKEMARKFARDAITARPDWGIPYILIGDLYASAKECVEDGNKVQAGALYWIASDKYAKAKSVDSGVAEMARSKMAQAAKHFPDKGVVHFENLKAGDPYTVECWIKETTTTRTVD